MSTMSKELEVSAARRMHGKRFALTAVMQFRRFRNKFTTGLPETMNAEGWHEKTRVSRLRLLAFGVSGVSPVSGIRPWWNTSADTNGRPFVRCRPPSPRQDPPSLFFSSLPTVPKSQRTLRPSLSRAAGRSPFLSSVQFKENTCHGHVPIHSYGFASRRCSIRVCTYPFASSAFLKCNVSTCSTGCHIWKSFPVHTRSTRSLFSHEFFRYGLANATRRNARAKMHACANFSFWSKIVIDYMHI